MSALTSGGEQVAQARAPAGLTGPAGTTTRFALLVMAVIATSALVFQDIYLAVPSNQVHVANARQACEQQLGAGLSRVGPADFEGRALLLTQFRRCLIPANLAPNAWAGYGVLILFTLAAVLYGLHPWRKINDWQFRGGRLARQRAQALPAERVPGLINDLGQLSREAGLSRPPVWLLSPARHGAQQPTGAVAFGLPWRRYVRLDPGLVVLRVTDPNGFRVTVRHELAHLSSGDVDKTFATFAIWQAFTAVALAPFLAVTLPPRLLSDPLAWRPGDVLAHRGQIIAVLALALLVYLTRSSILRLRELHADAAAAALDGSSIAVRARLDALLKAHRTSGRAYRPAWLSTHPDPGRRLAVLDDPSRLTPPSWRELAGVGIAAGVLAADAGFAFNQLFPASFLGPALGGALGAVPAIGLLAATLWRVVTSSGTGSLRRPRIWMALPPVALATGFCVGEPLALINSGAAGGYFTDSAASLAAMGVITVGGLLLTCWIVAAIRAAAATPGPPRRFAFPVVAMCAVTAATPWFAVWFSRWYLADPLAPALGYPPETGKSIGWYRLWAQWSDLTWPPLQWVLATPFTLPGLTLLWLAPLALMTGHRVAGPHSSRTRMPLRVALGAALTGTGAATVVNIALACAAKAALPVAVRLSPAPGVFFDSVYANTETVVAVLAEAAVAAAVVARTRRHRIPLALLAISATAMLNTASIPLVSDSVAKCMNVFGNKPASYPAITLRCVRVPPVGDSALTLHQLTAEGLVVAVPAALLAAAFTILRRTHATLAVTSTDGDTTGVQEIPGPRRPPSSRLLTASSFTLLPAVTGESAIVLLHHDWTVWLG